MNSNSVDTTRIRSGSRLRVRYGSHGSQLAVAAGPIVGGALQVKKFRRNAQRWTNTVSIHWRDILSVESY